MFLHVLYRNQFVSNYLNWNFAQVSYFLGSGSARTFNYSLGPQWELKSSF